MQRSKRNCFVIAAILLASVAAVLGWFALRESSTDREINRRLAELHATGEPITAEDLARQFPPPSAAENANILYGAAFRIATNNRPAAAVPFVGGTTWIPGRTNQLPESNRSALSAYCDQTRDLLAALPKNCPPATRFPDGWERGITNDSLSFYTVRVTAQALAAHTLDAQENRRTNDAAELLRLQFQFARAINPHHFVSGHFLRHAIERMACDSTERCLNRMRFTDDQLQGINEEMVLEKPGDLLAAVRADNVEHLWGFGQVHAGAPIKEFVGSHRVYDHWWERLWDRFFPEEPPYDASDYLWYLSRIPQSVRMTQMKPIDACKAAASLWADYGTNHASQMSKLHPMAGYRLMPAHAEAQGKMSATKVALAVERYRAARNDELPNSLDALVPQFLPKMLHDPFDDQPLRFKRLPHGYVVYSIGADGVDDGGTERTNLNMTAKYDVTFTVER